MSDDSATSSTAISENCSLDVRFGTTPPEDPHVGTRWINHITNEMRIWSGKRWETSEAMPALGLSEPAAVAEPAHKSDVPETAGDAW